MAYNGWQNWETWIVASWIGNDQDAEARSRYLVTEVVADSQDRDDAINSLVPQARELAEEIAMPSRSGLAADLVSAAFDSVDWEEIATNWLSDTDDSEFAGYVEPCADCSEESDLTYTPDGSFDLLCEDCAANRTTKEEELAEKA